MKPIFSRRLLSSRVVQRRKHIPRQCMEEKNRRSQVYYLYAHRGRVLPGLCFCYCCLLLLLYYRVRDTRRIVVHTPGKRRRPLRGACPFQRVRRLAAGGGWADGWRRRAVNYVRSECTPICKKTKPVPLALFPLPTVLHCCTNVRPGTHASFLPGRGPLLCFKIVFSIVSFLPSTKLRFVDFFFVLLKVFFLVYHSRRRRRCVETTNQFHCRISITVNTHPWAPPPCIRTRSKCSGSKRNLTGNIWIKTVERPSANRTDRCTTNSASTTITTVQNTSSTRTVITTRQYNYKHNGLCEVPVTTRPGLFL